MKKLFTLALLMALACSVAAGQESLEDRFRSFQKKSENQYAQFRDECNARYIEFLKEAWARFLSEPPVPQPEFDEVPPVVIDTPVVPEDNRLDADIEPVIPDIDANPVINPPVEPDPAVKTEETVFDFYGTPVSIKAPREARFSMDGECSGESISAAWEHLLESKADAALQDCAQIKERLHLCDWAYLQFLKQYSELFLGTGSEATILTAFLYCQSGYSMMIGIKSGSPVLLFESAYSIYDRPYYKIEGRNFYTFNGEKGEMEIANFTFPEKRGASLAIAAEPALSMKNSPDRTLSVKGVSVATSTVNTNLIDFYNAYPNSQYGDNFLTRWAIYAQTPASAQMRETLYPQLMQLVSDKPAYDAVSALLYFVQYAFKYEYDDKVWGHDRAFFAEETLFYPYADCEDRAILLSHLVRDLVGLDVALVYYPGHLATAVCFPEDVAGDYIQIDGKKYVICDPTYIGAPVGATMTGMNNSKAKVFVL